MELFYYIASFWLFVIAQSFVINGVYYCLKGSAAKSDVTGNVIYDGNIFYLLNPKFFERVRYKLWVKPLWGCVKCMSSFWGAVTFWPTIISIFGFEWHQIGIFLFDVFVLVTLNWIVYKKT